MNHKPETQRPDPREIVFAIDQLAHASAFSFEIVMKYVGSWVEVASRSQGTEQIEECLAEFSRSIEKQDGEIGNVFSVLCHQFDVSHNEMKRILGEDEFAGAEMYSIGIPEADYRLFMIAEQRGNIRGIQSAVREIRESLRTPQSEYQSVFISYATEDVEFVHKLYDALKSKGVDCFLAPRSLRAGHSLQLRIPRETRLRDRLVVCCSASTPTSDWVREELTCIRERERAVAREKGNPSEMIIPVDLDGALFSDPAWRDHPHGSELRDRVAAPFRGWESEGAFQKGVQALLEALKR